MGAVTDLVRALAYVKKAAAQTNTTLGAIDKPIADAIIQACNDLIEGQLHVVPERLTQPARPPV